MDTPKLFALSSPVNIKFNSWANIHNIKLPINKNTPINFTLSHDAALKLPNVHIYTLSKLPRLNVIINEIIELSSVLIAVPASYIFVLDGIPPI